MTKNFGSKSSKKFHCEFCDYTTTRKSQYDRHNLTLKHISTKNTKNISSEKCSFIEKVPHCFSCHCGKKYKHQSSLWNHRQKCVCEKEKDEEKEKEKEKEIIATAGATNNTLSCEVLVDLFKEMMKNQNEQMIELFKNGIGNTTNSHNVTNKNKFNLNFFLNEQCKDAMNIMDFVSTLQVQLSDLERVGELGYVKGISHIVANGLKDLDVCKRPIHCSDLKRETMYVKDENVWEKDESKVKLSKMIKHVAHKNQKQINAWQQKNPEYNDSESTKSEKFLKIVGESMSGLTNDDDAEHCTNKIIKNIAKEVTIKED